MVPMGVFAQLNDLIGIDSFIESEDVATDQDQSTFDKERGELFDSITDKLYSDPFTALRFSAVSLEDNPKYHVVQFAKVKVLLVYGRFIEALEEANRIRNPTWRARAFLVIGDFERINKRTDNAQSFYRQIFEFFDKNSKQEDNGKTLELVAGRFAIFGQYELMSRAINLISDSNKRIRTMEDLLKKLLESKDPRYKIIIAAIIKDSYDLVRNFDPAKNNDHFPRLNRIALAAVEAGVPQLAEIIYDDVLKKLITKDDFYSQRAYAEALAGKILIGNTRSVMKQIQELSLPSQRAIALATVARARSLHGDNDATVPLFNLALEEADNVRSAQFRNYVFHHIGIEMANVGRPQEALKTLTKIEDIQERIDALMEIAQLNLNNKKIDETIELLNFIPYTGMRAHIMIACAAQLASDIKNYRRVDALLLNALNETGAKPRLDYLRSAAIRLLNAQVRFGSADNDAKIFAKVRSVINLLNEPLLKVQLLSNIARIQINRKLVNEAKLTLNQAIIANYDLRKIEDQNIALKEIVGLKLYFGDYVDAFDNAARIIDLETDKDVLTDDFGRLTSPKVQALLEVATFLAGADDVYFQFIDSRTKKKRNLEYPARVDLAMRAARQIPHNIPQAVVIAEVAISLKNYTNKAEARKNAGFVVPDNSYAQTQRDDITNIKIDFNDIIIKNNNPKNAGFVQ